MTTTRTVTAHNFSVCTDQQIIDACREMLASCEPGTLRPYAAKLLKSKSADVTECGTILWAHLCKWPKTWLKK